MVLSNKQKAFASFAITLVLGVIGVFLAFSGLPPEVKPFLDLTVSLITVIGTTLGVYQTTNKPLGSDAETTEDTADLTDVSAEPVAVVPPVAETPAPTTGE